MAFQLPSLPNFSSAIPQQPSPIDQYGRMLQLKSLMGQQQLIPLQVQEAQQNVQASTLKNQQLQMEIDSQKNLQKADSDGVFNKFAGVETPDGSGFDASGAYKELVGNRNVLPDQAAQYVGSLLKNAQTQAEIRKTQGQAGEAEQNIREKTLKSVANKLASIGDMKADDAAAALDQFHQDLVKNPKAYAGLSQQELGELYGVQLGHLDTIEAHFGILDKVADFHKAKSDAAVAAQKVIPEGGGMSADAKQELQKEIALATNPQVQAGKVAVASAEGAARGAQQVLTEVAKENALAPALDSLMQTTRAGRKYIDASQLPEKSASLLRKQAAQAGVPVVTKEAADSLSQIDTAKANQQYMLDTIGKKLASGAPERLWYGPANTIEKMAQSDPEMAAVGTFRNAAIQSMRAVAGSKGLRINQAEIEMAIDNDIPKLTDTLPVAQAKLKNLQQFLENNEQAMLVRNRQQTGSGSGDAREVTATGPNGHKIVVRDGKWVDAQTGQPVQ